MTHGGDDKMQGELLSNVTTIEDEQIMIRPVRADDKDAFLRILEENSEFPKAFGIEGYRENLWDVNLNDEDRIAMMVFLKETGWHIGNCTFRGIGADTVHIGIGITGLLQNKGYGTKVLSLLVDYLQRKAPDRRHLIRTKSNNLRCQRMIRKVGGKKVGEEATDLDKILDHLRSSLKRDGFTKKA